MMINAANPRCQGGVSLVQSLSGTDPVAIATNLLPFAPQPQPEAGGGVEVPAYQGNPNNPPVLAGGNGNLANVAAANTGMRSAVNGSLRRSLKSSTRRGWMSIVKGLMTW